MDRGLKKEGSKSRPGVSDVLDDWRRELELGVGATVRGSNLILGDAYCGGAFS